MVKGSSTGFSLVGPAKVKGCKFFYSLKGSLVLKIKSTWLILFSHLILISLCLNTLRNRIIGLIVGTSKVSDQSVDTVSKNETICLFYKTKRTFS